MNHIETLRAALEKIKKVHSPYSNEWGSVIFEMRDIANTALAATAEPAQDDLTAQLAAMMKERDALAKDAARYKVIRNKTSAVVHDIGSGKFCAFDLPTIHPKHGMNLLKGSVAGHLDTAIDAAIAATKGEQA